MKYWNFFHIEERERVQEWDGQDVIDRLTKYIENNQE